MKLLSWNINGIRAASKAGLEQWVSASGADVISFQEIKANPEQVPQPLKDPKGFKSIWNPAEKPGYSGVGVLTRMEPLEVRTGIGDTEIDAEGRVLELEFKDFVLINAYFPNSQREHQRLPFKLKFCKKIHEYCRKKVQGGKSIVLCGDYNVAHREIDLKNPKTNQNNAGFLPEERAWMDEFLSGEFVDIFREREPAPGHYTWWSYRPGVRERNIGWRIDYHCVSRDLIDRVGRVWHEPNVRGSDHCPIGLELSR